MLYSVELAKPNSSRLHQYSNWLPSWTLGIFSLTVLQCSPYTCIYKWVEQPLASVATRSVLSLCDCWLGPEWQSRQECKNSPPSLHLTCFVPKVRTLWGSCLSGDVYVGEVAKPARYLNVSQSIMRDFTDYWSCFHRSRKLGSAKDPVELLILLPCCVFVP